jgi:uncharacterized membrane protein (DUF4010 family)
MDSRSGEKLPSVSMIDLVCIRLTASIALRLAETSRREDFASRFVSDQIGNAGLLITAVRHVYVSSNRLSALQHTYIS